MNLYDVFVMVPEVIENILIFALNALNGVLSFWGSIGGLPGFIDIGGVGGLFNLFATLLTSSFGF